MLPGLALAAAAWSTEAYRTGTSDPEPQQSDTSLLTWPSTKRSV